MKLLVILILLIGFLLHDVAVLPSAEIKRLLVKRAADAAVAVYYPFLEKDIYPLPEIVVEKEDTDPNTANRGWFLCKGKKCSIHIIVDNHLTENELVYTIAHELVHTFFMVQGLPTVKHHRIMYCEGYDIVLAKKVGYVNWDKFRPTGVDKLCGRWTAK